MRGILPLFLLCLFIPVAHATLCGTIRLTEVKIKDKATTVLAHRSNDTIFYDNKLNASVLEQLQPYHIESTCREIAQQKNTILALLIIKYDIANDGEKSWYHDNAYCMFINTQTKRIVTQREHAVCAGKWIKPWTWVTEQDERINFMP